MIEFENGEIARLTLKRGAAHNALTRAMMAEIEDILRMLARSSSRVLILAAEGKTFCAGVDFQELLSGDWSDNPLTNLCRHLANLPIPTIAALQGPFVGGGAELAFSCDFRIATPDVRCQVPAAKIGVHYEPQGIARVASIAGVQLAKRLFLATESFDAEALLSFHAIDKIVPAEGLQDAVEAKAETLAHLAPLALRGMKQTLGAWQDFEDPSASARIEAAFASEDFQEAMIAIREKRKPIFHGK